MGSVTTLGLVDDPVRVAGRDGDGDAGRVGIAGALGGGCFDRVSLVSRVGIRRYLEQEHTGPTDTGGTLAVDRFWAEPKLAVGVEHAEHD